MLMKRRVVVFDSGIGGLNLLNECVKRVPDADYFYVSDTGNVPYGNKSKSEVLSLTLNALKSVEDVHPSALVIACNTVTANCIEELRLRFDFPVVGIQPAIKTALESYDDCLVLATNATAKSESLARLIKMYGKGKVRTCGCERLAGFVEENVFSLPSRLPMDLLPEEKCSCVVLGCTHYSFVKRQIALRYGCVAIDGTGPVADRFAKIVGTGNHFSPLLGKISHFAKKMPKITFFGGDNEKNSQIFKMIYKNDCLNM